MINTDVEIEAALRSASLAQYARQATAANRMSGDRSLVNLMRVAIEICDRI